MTPRKPGRWKGARVLVTGASGFIGSHLARSLAAQGAEVTGLSRSLGRLHEGLPGVRMVSCDLTSDEHTRAVISNAQPQFVFHLAAHPDGPECRTQTHNVLAHNLTGLVHLLEALRELPAVSLIYGDSAKVYGNSGVPYRVGQPIEPLGTYAVSKAAGWSLIDVYRRVHGIRAVGLRPTLVYGPGQGFNLFTFLSRAVAGGQDEIQLDGGVQTRDPLYIDDAVAAFIGAAENACELNGTSVPLGGGREISVLELAELAIRLWGGHQKVVCRPTSVRPTETMRSWCDNLDASRAFGWKPVVSLEQGLTNTARFLKVPVAASAPWTTEQAEHHVTG